MKIITAGTIEKIASKVDGTVNVTFGTQELDATQAGNLFALRGKYCKVLLSDNNITQLEDELVDKTPIASGKKNKSESQRLRNVLYLIAEKNGQDFEQFYKSEMNKIIEHYKGKLE